MLPSITNVINLADSHDRAAFAMVTHVKQEPRERENSESKEEVMLQIVWSFLFTAEFPFLWTNFISALDFGGALGGQEQCIKTCLYLKVLDVVPPFS